jgi:hypothetical protein
MLGHLCARIDGENNSANDTGYDAELCGIEDGAGALARKQTSMH